MDTSNTKLANSSNAQEKPGKMLVSLSFNIIIPVVILSKYSGPENLGAVRGFLIALAFPFIYGTHDLIAKRQWNFLSIMGIISVLLAGGLALFELDRFWFAVKEASIPAIIGVAVFLSDRMKHPIVKNLLFNPQVLNVDQIKESLDKNNKRELFERLFTRTTYLICLSLALSSVLNFVLAIWILKSPSGTPEFNKEYGLMMALSFPVIALPCMIVTLGSLWYLIMGIKKLTGLDLNHIFKDPKAK